MLKKAADQGVVTVNIGYNFMRDPPGTVSTPMSTSGSYGEMVARQLLDDTRRQGQDRRHAADRRLDPPRSSSSPRCRTCSRPIPDIELLSAEYGDWDRAKAKQLTENLLQRFPQIDGVFSPAGQMSLGIYEAFDEAGRLGELTLSPGDDYNGWTKWSPRTSKWGAVTSGLEVGREAVKRPSRS